MDVPLKVVQERDPKGLYKKVAAGELKGFSGVDDPYEAPPHPEIRIKNKELGIQESVNVMLRKLVEEGVLSGAPTHEHGLPFPDGDAPVDLHVSASQKKKKLAEAAELPRVLLTDIDVNWLQTVGEGWAAPLKGFMRQGALLQTIHFNSLLVDPLNITGSTDYNEQPTEFQDVKTLLPPKRVSMSVPITLAITGYTKDIVERSGKQAVTLVNKHGQSLAILRNPEIYANRKEEIVSRIFGVIDRDHPYINYLYSGGDWLIGGEVELLERIKYNDGLDKWRLTAAEVTEEFKKRDADAVFAFQTRNPTHAGHAYLMKEGGKMLKSKGYKNPVLLLSPLGGWTKFDDVPLDVRVKQHEAVLAAKELDPKSTVMHIWPAPMIYGGPTEVLFHAKSRRNAGATYFVAGRDPAGMKGSLIAEAHPDDDLYDGDHGRYVLAMSPGQEPMNILSFGKVFYDTRDHEMKDKDPKRPDDFISISGTKMRALAAAGASPCKIDSSGHIPTDLLGANCIPPGFMVQTGWEIVCDYYQNKDEKAWVPYSVMVVEPREDEHARSTGQYGTTDYRLSVHHDGKLVSPWHDIALEPSSGVYHFVVEIPMYSTAKMEMNKEEKHNPIMQDTSAGAPRYYHYGAPMFNYGFLPQTWESNRKKDSTTGRLGDNDPIDAIEIGPGALDMGSVHRVKILGSLALIDGGETDHKVVVIRDTDPLFDSVDDVDELDHKRPGTKESIIDWMKMYKTAEGKGINELHSEEFTTPRQAKAIVEEVAGHYQELIDGDVGNDDEFFLP
jgi:3'-phosphoadenosine 5'-phosphosulfate synthase